MKTAEQLKEKRESIRLVILTALLTLLLFALQSCQQGQEEKPQIQFDYQNEVSDAEITSQIVDYYEGSDLTVELFEAENYSNENRPLILLAPGGGWSRYTQLDKLKSMATNFAKRGYVVGILEYEIGGRTGDIWVKGVQDFKTAVRYFKKYATEYNIDPNNIFTGGWSTGGQLAQYAAYLTEEDFAELDQPFLKDILEPAVNTMGFEGDLFLDYTSDVKGTLIMMPYTFDVNIFDAGEPPIMLVAHPFQHFASGKQIWGAVFDSGVTNYGPDLIKERLLEVGYKQNEDLGYVVMPERTREDVHVNAMPLESENYEYIINYLFANLD